MSNMISHCTLKASSTLPTLVLFQFLEINECDSSPCQNKGMCEDLINAFRCHCMPGYTGTFCESGENQLTTGYYDKEA